MSAGFGTDVIVHRHLGIGEKVKWDNVLVCHFGGLLDFVWIKVHVSGCRNLC